MRESPETWWDDLRQSAELPPEPPTARLPAILAAVLAVAASAGLGWWLSSSGDESFDPAPSEIRTAAPTAGAAADEQQVRRAYEEFTAAYAEGGSEGLARVSGNCASSVKKDPQLLDFCLAFDLFADSVRVWPDAAAFAEAEARRLALAHSALPAGTDPARRVADIRRLTGLASGAGLADAREASEGRVAIVESPARQKATNVVSSKPVRTPNAGARRPSATISRDEDPFCRLPTSSVDRLVCADPALRRQESRMKAAYERALAAGADPLVVDRGQAEWRRVRDYAAGRSELQELYARRTRELNEIAEAAVELPPS